MNKSIHLIQLEILWTIDYITCRVFCSVMYCISCGKNTYQTNSKEQTNFTLPVSLTLRNTRGQSRMDNPETLATLGTQDTGRRQIKKNTTQHRKLKS